MIAVNKLHHPGIDNTHQMQVKYPAFPVRVSLSHMTSQTQEVLYAQSHLMDWAYFDIVLKCDCLE